MPRSEILAVTPRATGMTHVVFDHAVDTRPQLVVFTDQAHVLLGLEPQAWFHKFVAAAPHRGTQVNG